MNAQNNLMARSRRAGADNFGAFGAFLIFSLVFFGRILPGHFSDYYIGSDTDPSLYMWSLAWWSYVVHHHVQLFFTDLIWAPHGLNLALVTTMPLVGVIAAPLTSRLGPVATFNLIALMALPLNAFATYLLCRRITKSFLAALLGGFVFGFSPYMMAQLLGHLVLVLVFPIPLAVYLVVRRLEGSFSRMWFVIALATTLSAQFLLELEPFAMMLVVGVCAILIPLATASGEAQKRARELTAEICEACLLTALLMSPYLYQYLAYGFPDHALWSASTYSADLLNFVVPTPANALGNNSIARAISKSFSGNILEQGAFIGVSLLTITLVWARRHRGELLTKVLIGTLLVVCVLSLGPFFQVAGRSVFPMPWLALQKLPLLKSALPIRQMVFAFVPLAIIFALWLCDPLTGATERAVGVIATLLMLMPNPAASFWAIPASVPEFFRNGTSQRLLSNRDIVLPLPFGQKGMCMLWQADSGMNFRMASGLTGLQPIEIRRWPVVNLLVGSPDLPEPELQLKAFVANLGITAIVVDASDARTPQWTRLLANLNVEPQAVGGVLLYRIPPDAFAAYRGMNAIDLEQRAERARFETVISATDKYVASGGVLAKLDVPALQSAGLLPAEWTFDNKPGAYRDIWSGIIDGKIGIGVAGSASGLRPIIESYRADAGQIYFPYPRRWSPHGPQSFLKTFFAPEVFGSTSGESIQLMVMTFDPAQLKQVAARLPSQPSVNLAAAPREASR